MYILCPGNITSRTDGEVHYISCQQLIELYNVPPEECIPIHMFNKYGRSLTKNDRFLYPRHDGNYEL